ncbi:hypothetical protein [Sphaerisporangium perillae]|uniref:hypothetical protein n=1 Tax=Sphaerisporangium perillae TaxID=2935860 RepID=UPI00200BA967|nr:hypothetical protein [Sphaerisporangium perillae]
MVSRRAFALGAAGGLAATGTGAMGLFAAQPANVRDGVPALLERSGAVRVPRLLGHGRRLRLTA